METIFEEKVYSSTLIDHLCFVVFENPKQLEVFGYLSKTDIQFMKNIIEYDMYIVNKIQQNLNESFSLVEIPNFVLWIGKLFLFKQQFNEYTNMNVQKVNVVNITQFIVEVLWSIHLIPISDKEKGCAFMLINTSLELLKFNPVQMNEYQNSCFLF